MEESSLIPYALLPNLPLSYYESKPKDLLVRLQHQLVPSRLPLFLSLPLSSHAYSFFFLHQLQLLLIHLLPHSVNFAVLEMSPIDERETVRKLLMESCCKLFCADYKQPKGECIDVRTNLSLYRASITCFSTKTLFSLSPTPPLFFRRSVKLKLNYKPFSFRFC